MEAVPPPVIRSRWSPIGYRILLPVPAMLPADSAASLSTLTELGWWLGFWRSVVSFVRFFCFSTLMSLFCPLKKKRRRKPLRSLSPKFPRKILYDLPPQYQTSLKFYIYKKNYYKNRWDINMYIGIKIYKNIIIKNWYRYPILFIRTNWRGRRCHETSTGVDY